MNKHILLLLASLLLLGISGCGVDQDKHDRALEDLANKDAALQLKDQQLRDCQQSLDACKQNYEETSTLLSALGKDYEESRDRLNKLVRAREARQQALNNLLTKFDDLIKSGKVSIVVRDGRMLINLPSKVLFGFNKWDLSKDGKETLKQVADVIKQLDERRFQIAGHTDNVQGPGSVNPNWRISFKRAESVFRLLTGAGVPEKVFSLAAYAEYSPVASNDTEEGREQNRRIEIVLMPTTEELPLVQLKKIEKITNEEEGENQ